MRCVRLPLVHNERVATASLSLVVFETLRYTTVSSNDLTTTNTTRRRLRTQRIYIYIARLVRSDSLTDLLA